MDTARHATIYSGKSGVSTAHKGKEYRIGSLGTLLQCGKARLLDDKSYAMTREEDAWEAQYHTRHFPPLFACFLKLNLPRTCRIASEDPSAGPFHSGYGALPLLPFHCVYTRILERTWRRTANLVPPALFPPSQCLPTVFLMGFDHMEHLTQRKLKGGLVQVH